MGSDIEIKDFQPIILFDGVCNLCNSSVNFIIDRDPKKPFKFTSLQSDIGQYVLSKYASDKSSFDSVALLQNEQLYIKSSAALRIAKQLSGLWSLMIVFWIIPYPIRDFIYDFIARNRYKWFGKMDACRVPSPELKERFLDS